MSEKFRVSGRKFEIPQPGRIQAKWSMRPGGWAVATLPDGTRLRIQMSESRGQLGVSIGGYLYQGQLQSESFGGSLSGGTDADLTAQFSGKVRKVLVSQNTSVEEGQPLVLVEAMKMEFTIKAPFAGRVTKILVQEGQQLAPGDRFVELEERK